MHRKWMNSIRQTQHPTDELLLALARSNYCSVKVGPNKSARFKSSWQAMHWSKTSSCLLRVITVSTSMPSEFLVVSFVIDCLHSGQVFSTSYTHFVMHPRQNMWLQQSRFAICGYIVDSMHIVQVSNFSSSSSSYICSWLKWTVLRSCAVDWFALYLSDASISSISSSFKDSDSSNPSFSSSMTCCIVTILWVLLRCRVLYWGVDSASSSASIWALVRFYVPRRLPVNDMSCIKFPTSATAVADSSLVSFAFSASAFLLLASL